MSPFRTAVVFIIFISWMFFLSTLLMGQNKFDTNRPLMISNEKQNERKPSDYTKHRNSESSNEVTTQSKLKDDDRHLHDFESFNVETSITTPVHVLLLAYQRSGSSFLGEILSARPEAMYIFEPLIEISNKRRMKKPNEVLSAITSIYNCDVSVLDIIGDNKTAGLKMLRKVALSKGASYTDYVTGCIESKIKVIKTIRLRMKVAQKLLEDSRLKIVHLVRDPRAILNSMRTSKTWSNNSKTAEYQCEQLRTDIASGLDLPEDKYIRVRYEDLAANPLQVAVKLYEFLHIPLHASLSFYLATHTETEKFFKFHHKKPAYFSTYRKSTYDHNSWMASMSSAKIREIEMHCSDVLESLHYSVIQNHSRST